MLVGRGRRRGGADGCRRASRSALSELQSWKRERLLENDAYTVRTYGQHAAATPSELVPEGEAP